MHWNRLSWLEDCVLGAFVLAIVLLCLASRLQANGAMFIESYRDPSDPKHVFAVFDTGSPDGTYVLHSLDGGQTWRTVVGPEGHPITVGGRMSVGEVVVRVAPLAEPRLIITYRPGGDELWRAGSDLRWKSIKRGLPPGSIARLLPTANGDIFFVIIEDGTGGELFLTETGGTAWHKVHDRLPFGARGEWNVHASADGKVLVGADFVGADGRAVPEGYMSRDGGKSWKRIPPAQKEKEFSAMERRRQESWPITGTAAQKEAAFQAITAGDPRKKRTKELEEEFERTRKK